MYEKNMDNYIFQHDNAPPHSAKPTIERVQENNISIIEWPPCSLDCNPIENLSSIICQIVYKYGRQYSSVQELEVSIEAAWQSIPIET